jgi:putative transposase
MGSVGDCYDNATCKSFFATLECELLARTHFKTREQARQALFSWIEGWYNVSRRPSGTGYRSPIRYEQLHDEKNRTCITGELPTAGRRRGRDKRPAGRPWTTRRTAQAGGSQPSQNSTA